MHLINCIAKGDSIELKKLASTYTEQGAVNFPALFAIPSCERLAGLSSILGERELVALVMVLITRFQNSFNLQSKMDADQIAESAFDMVIRATEYNCTLQDLVVFFEQAKASKYGRIEYNRIDSPTLLTLFEKYLDERYDAIKLIRDQKYYAYVAEKREIDKSLGRGFAGFAASLDAVLHGMKNRGLPASAPNASLSDKEVRHPENFKGKHYKPKN